ncbi:hypothetical protein [Streptomyces purpureus]|uniref:Uncharacterized protein n=1 Tax=Streptomyces purpureus TaxID=1951 RepID=A0A918LML8_9ACTN|nr:hypothetical protein [Streptomyces purpureus]GGT20290.1 hypothetical protein GCM10014713_11330 [Streptomyces purpureus]
MNVDRSSWDGAVRHLYEDAFCCMVTGPRCHEDWRSDVLAVMRRPVPDPRGWLTLDDTAEDPEREVRPAYPFRVFTAEELGERLFPITHASAEELLLALTDDSCTLQNVRRFGESMDELRVLARTVLARYGTDFACYTNITDASDAGVIDFTTSGRSWVQLSEYADDAVLVVVSEDEVGLFATFGDY